ncbi:MAG: T9SS type A sorting domain-containing protein [Flavobacteriales bacterium]|nr:T9SS type A sorting domain-containing protein [Flavobacteriales bacterium]
MRFLLVLFVLFLNANCFAGGWIQKADFGGIARHRTTMLTIGNKIYIGLGHYNGAGPNILFNDWWEYDPSTNSWSQKADYLGGDCYHATGFTMNNIAYVGTGRTSASGSTLVQNFYKYDVSTNAWTEITSFPGVGRRGAVSFVIGDYAYTGTGESNSGILGSFYRFDPLSETWTQVSSLPAVRTSAVAFSIDNFGYVGTGDLDPGSTNDFWQYDPSQDLWTQKASVGPKTRKEAMGFALDGKGYIGTGGNNLEASLSDMWEYSPTTDTWVQIEDFQGTARRYFSATTLNGVAYAALGTNGTNFKDLWMFDRTLSLLEESLSDATIKVYPNPASEYIQIDLELPETIDETQLRLEIVNTQGKIIYQSNWTNQTTIQTDSWPKGSYLYRIKYNEHLVRSESFIILSL